MFNDQSLYGCVQTNPKHAQGHPVANKRKTSLGTYNLRHHIYIYIYIRSLGSILTHFRGFSASNSTETSTQTTEIGWSMRPYQPKRYLWGLGPLCLMSAQEIE